MAYQAYTLTQMQSMLAEKYESVPFWVATEATYAINEALLTWNSLTGFWKGTQIITTTAGSWDYALDSSLVFGSRVEFNSIPMAEASMGDLDGGHPGWQGQTTATGGSVPTQPKKWFPMSIDLIGIWPADAVGGNTLTVYGIAQTPQLVNGGDFINIGNEALDVILGFSLHILSLKEGGERFTKCMPYFTEFLKEAAEENDQLMNSSMFRYIIGTDVNRQTRVTRGVPTDYDQMGGRVL